MGSRVENEKQTYNQGFDNERAKYNKKFGHSNVAGYYSDYKNDLVHAILKKAKGKKILELGSTSWINLLDMENYYPNELTCINISSRELQKGINIYNDNKQNYLNTKFEFIVMDAHHLDFKDECFDIVIGGGILHHLDLEVAVKEVSRVLKKDGFCLFIEPLACNPIGKLVRSLTPNARTKDEKPLEKKDIDIINKNLNCQYRFIQLFYVLAGFISAKIFKTPYNRLMKMAFMFDCFLEKHSFTSFRLLYRFIIINGMPIN